MMNQFSTGITPSRLRFTVFMSLSLTLAGCGQSGNLVLPQKTGKSSNDSGYFAPTQHAQEPTQ